MMGSSFRHDEINMLPSPFCINHNNRDERSDRPDWAAQHKMNPTLSHKRDESACTPRAFLDAGYLLFLPPGFTLTDAPRAQIQATQQWLRQIITQSLHPQTIISYRRVLRAR
ncbi:hypothetical protein V2G26_001484 [Clonostachys chloroleuca]